MEQFRRVLMAYGYDDEIEENFYQLVLWIHLCCGFVHRFHLPGRSGVGLLLTLPTGHGRGDFTKPQRKISKNF
jgi:hypothetical protein